MRRENDAGMRCYRGGRHGEAFGRFTEAVRLCPGSAVFHANRASAALKLGRYDTAMDAAK
jgi:DnaJ family protein C protein 7